MFTSGSEDPNDIAEFYHMNTFCVIAFVKDCTACSAHLMTKLLEGSSKYTLVIFDSGNRTTEEQLHGLSVPIFKLSHSTKVLLDRPVFTTVACFL